MGRSDDFADALDESHGQQERIDWSFRVVRHSPVKTRDKCQEYGFHIMHRWLHQWNQESISPTYKPGDCTPSEFGTNADDAYITIELYRAIKIRQVSLYHFHSPALSQRAIDAAPKDFEVFASYNLSTWHNLGNFSYDYDADSNTQYFDILNVFGEGDQVVDEDANDDADGAEVALEDDEGDDGLILDSASTSTSMKAASSDEQYANGFKFIAFRLVSNYGGSDYSCIYRLRVFGDVVS